MHFEHSDVIETCDGIMFVFYPDLCLGCLMQLFLLFPQRTAGFDLYAVFDPLIAKSQAILLGNKLIRWINVSVWRLGSVKQFKIFISNNQPRRVNSGVAALLLLQVLS